MRLVLTVVLAVAMLPAFGDEIDATPIPLGITDLLSTVTFTVGYQHFDKLPTWLGHGWLGFDPSSGVYWTPDDTLDASGQVFVHCPWRGGTGITFGDCALRLPRTERIRLAFKIGIRPSARGTDGVTYRVKVNGEDVFDRHCTSKEFLPFEVDLSSHAGEEVTLRLEVDPGPDRIPTDDWSLWRDVQVLAGSEEQLAEAARKMAEETARRRAEDIARAESAARVPLLPLTSHTNDSVCPSTLEPTQVSVREDGGAYVFRCEGDETIEYRFDPREGLLGGISVIVDGEELQPAPFQGGPRVHLDGAEFAPPVGPIESELVSVSREGPRVSCEYRYTRLETGASATLRAVLWPEGKSLGLEVWGADGRFGGFRAQPNGGRSVSASFAVGGAPMWRREGVYLSTVADLMRSEATGVRAHGTGYTPLTDGARNAMHDLFYLTVTSRYEEALSNITHKPSPFLDELSGRVVLDAWGGSFAQNEQWLVDMALYGIDGFLIIKHVWQRDGYDRSYPNVMPANASMGGDEALRSLSLTAQRLGHRFNVHENLYDFYPNAEAFKEADCALDPEGEPVPGWDRGPVKAITLKPSKLMDYVREFTPEVKRRYDCDSAYHDIMPTWHVDYDADVADAGKIRVTHEITRELCDYDREIFGGPVVFEAATAAMAGVYDGGCNHGQDTYRIPTAVAYNLLKVHPKMSNHGFGYYERWLPWGYASGWNTYVMTDRELDKYRAYQIAFGRTGFIGQQIMKHAHAVVREYHLMQAFGRAYTGKRARRIRYAVSGPDDRVGDDIAWVDAGTAARYGALSRINIEYEGDQQVWVNLSEDAWEIGGHTLPPNGALTVGPRAEAWTAIRDGQISDYARYRHSGKAGAGSPSHQEILYCDARSQQWLPSVQPAPIQPSLGSFEHLGGGRFQLAVDWKPSRKPERDYTIFWHFKDGVKIESQADHRPPRAATTWRLGETFTDGPIVLSVKDDPDVTAYDIVVGMYDKEGRAALVDGADEARIGRLIVQRDGAKAVSVRAEELPPLITPGSTPAPYLEDANTQERIIDFGEIATNGAVVCRKLDGRIEIVPTPIGEEFTIGIRGSLGSVSAFSAAGDALPAPSLSRRDGRTWLDTSANAARYVARP